MIYVIILRVPPPQLFVSRLVTRKVRVTSKELTKKKKKKQNFSSSENDPAVNSGALQSSFNWRMEKKVPYIDKDLGERQLNWCEFNFLLFGIALEFDLTFLR